MSSDNDADLLVIGGGVLGAFHAHAALQRGLRVTLVERHSEPRGATVRNFGQVVPSGLNRQWQPLGRESLRIYKSIQSEFDLALRSLGSVYIASTAGEVGLLEELRAINRAEDYPSELWTRAECLQRYPQLRSDYCRGGLFFPEEVSVNPRQMIHRLHRFLSQHADYSARFQTCIRELGLDGAGRVRAVSTQGEAFTASKAVLCCGHELQTLYPDLLHASDIELVKLQMLRLSPQGSVSMPGNVLTGYSIRRYESFSECPSWDAVQTAQPPDTFASRWDVHLLFKQEVDGGIILGDSHEFASPTNAHQLGFDSRHDINEYFVNEGKKVFDLPDWTVEATWCGTYTQTGDPAGIFTRTIDDNIHIVTAIGGKGMTSSAGFAQHHMRTIYEH